MKVYSKDGVEMMGAMAAVIHIKPEDMWEAFTLFPVSVKLRMPGLLWKGWRASRNKAG